MTGKILKVLLLVAVVFLISTEPGHAQQPILQCPEGSLLEPWTMVCVDVNDARDRFSKDAAKTDGHKIPGLGELRRDKARKRGEVATDLPTPGGLGAGITYNTGNLQSLKNGWLYTKMYFYPNGVSPSGFLDWLFTTATNRTEQTVEVVGIYGNGSGNSTPGTLGIFDWSCSPGYPCMGGETGASWVWFADAQQLACYMSEISDQGGHRQTILYYLNSSDKFDQQNPPLWVNAVTLWNFCTNTWNIVYQHQFRSNQKDCSLANDCGWWGPIIETFANPHPDINELGFQESLLIHDGITSYLDPSETGFVDPQLPFVLFHKDPDRGFGAGNFSYANAETMITGTSAGSYLDTFYSDNQYETLNEVVQGTTSALEHHWTFNVIPGRVVVFHVEAYRSANLDRDDFRFDYSTDGVKWTPMLTVSKSADDNSEQTYTMHSGTQGTIYVRVVDTSRSKNKKSLDSVFIDRLYFSSEQ